MSLLWVRELDSPEPRPADWARRSSDEFAHHPFWSPDSHSIGFFGTARAETDFGVGRRTAEARGRRLAEGRDVVLERRHSLHTRRQRRPPRNFRKWRRSNGGDRAAERGELGAQLAVVSARWPAVSLHGQTSIARSTHSEAGIYLGSLDAPEVRRLLPDVSSAVYSTSGYILFLREGILTAAPFDETSGDSKATPSPSVKRSRRIPSAPGRDFHRTRRRDRAPLCGILRRPRTTPLGRSARSHYRRRERPELFRRDGLSRRPTDRGHHQRRQDRERRHLDSRCRRNGETPDNVARMGGVPRLVGRRSADRLHLDTGNGRRAAGSRHQWRRADARP